MIELLSMTGNDKFIEHPVLGNVSCSGFNEVYKRCNNLMGRKYGPVEIQCRILYDMSKKKVKSIISSISLLQI